MVANEPMQKAEQDGVLQDMPRGSKKPKGRGMMRYGESEYDYGVWEEFEARILEYEDGCGVLDCGKGDDDSQWKYLEEEL